ncbi:DUF2163 domain-containing protein [Escherichia coli]|nr:DUF2163 domain-containing protein [Escherichia coli]MEC9706017.1 DUF2163 domain-containing protein [Escherichia marmotae]
MDDLKTNANLLKYWNLTRGGNRKSLTIQEIMSLGQHVTCFDVFPRGQNAIHWTDAFIDLNLNSVVYQSFPDIIQDSLPSFSEEKGISNNSISFKVSNIDNSVQILALGNGLFKAKVNIIMVILDPYTTTPIYQMLMFSGFIDYCQATADPNQKVTELTINVNSIYQKLDVQTRTIASDSVYQSYYPGDAFMSLLGQVNQANQEWKMK